MTRRAITKRIEKQKSLELIAFEKELEKYPIEKRLINWFSRRKDNKFTELAKLYVISWRGATIQSAYGKVKGIEKPSKISKKGALIDMIGTPLFVLKFASPWGIYDLASSGKNYSLIFGSLLGAVWLGISYRRWHLAKKYELCTPQISPMSLTIYLADKTSKIYNQTKWKFKENIYPMIKDNTRGILSEMNYPELNGKMSFRFNEPLDGKYLMDYEHMKKEAPKELHLL